MNDITLNPARLADMTGLNKYDLLQSEIFDVNEQYKEVFKNVEGSLTTVSDNDAQSKIQVAITTLNPTDSQAFILAKFRESCMFIENRIEPERLRFSIGKTPDDEICISRNSDNGVTNIIINDDGSVAYSFIAYKQFDKKDFFKFYDACDVMDCESLTFKFFSL